MAFKYDPSKGICFARDTEHGLTIRGSPKFYDTASPTYLQLEDINNNLKFDFPVYAKQELVTVQAKAGPTLTPMTTATFIVKQDAERLYKTMFAAYSQRGIAFISRDEFFPLLIQGVHQMNTHGENLLKFVPSYYTSLIDNRPPSR
jgi:hypothetical protein